MQDLVSLVGTYLQCCGEVKPVGRQGPSSPIESSVDVLLALFYAPSEGEVMEPVRGTTRLQKLLFLLWKEGRFQNQVPDLYNFQAFDYGPCMDDVYDDLSFLEDVGLVQVTEVPSGNEFEDCDERAFTEAFGVALPQPKTRKDYSLTERGAQEARKLYDALDEGERMALVGIKSKYNRMPLFALLRYVYQRYPSFARKSLLRL